MSFYYVKSKIVASCVRFILFLVIPRMLVPWAIVNFASWETAPSRPLSGLDHGWGLGVGNLSCPHRCRKQRPEETCVRASTASSEGRGKCKCLRNLTERESEPEWRSATGRMQDWEQAGGLAEGRRWRADASVGLACGPVLATLSWRRNDPGSELEGD